MTAKAQSKTLRVKVRRLPHAVGLPLPEYQTSASAGLDLIAALPENEPLVLAPGERALLPTGLQIALPRGAEAQVRPRSGLAAKHGVTVLNSPGTIDADYRGEISVILVNLGESVVTLKRGDRIAQLVVAPVARAVLVETDTLDQTRRGVGGFGSTGIDDTKPRKSAKTRKVVPRSKPIAKRQAKGVSMRAKRTRRP